MNVLGFWHYEYVSIVLNSVGSKLDVYAVGLLVYFS
jgi:hypothetical protein